MTDKTTTASDSELRECPFCGGAAGYIPHTLHNGVRCLTDSCPLSIQAMSKPQWNTRPAQPVDRELDLYHDFARLRNAFLITYDLAGIDASPLPEALPESVYVPGYMDKVRELREVYALVTAAAPLPVETLGDDDTAICPNPSCHKAFSNDMLRDDKRIPTHDFPEPCRSVCPGSGQWPANYAGAKVSALPVDTQGAGVQLSDGKDNAWPVTDVLRKLAFAAEHLGLWHNCDHHGYEEIIAAKDAAYKYLAEPAATQPADDGEQLDFRALNYKRVCDQLIAKTDEAVALKAQLKGLSQPAWRDIASAPKDGTRILIYLPESDNFVLSVYWDEQFEYHYDEERATKEPSYSGHHTGAWTDDAVQSYGMEERCSYDPKVWQPTPAPPTPAGDFCYAKGDQGSRYCGSPKAMHCSVPGDEAFWTSPEGRTHLIACVGDRHLIHHRFVPATPASGEPHEFLEQPRGKFPKSEYAIDKCWEVVNMVYCGQPRDAEVHVQPASREDER